MPPVRSPAKRGNGTGYFTRLGAASQKSNFGQGSGKIWMDDLECVGTELALSDCPFNGWGDNNCAHWADAGVACQGPPGAAPPPAPRTGDRAPRPGAWEVETRARKRHRHGHRPRGVSFSLWNST